MCGRGAEEPHDLRNLIFLVTGPIPDLDWLHNHGGESLSETLGLMLLPELVAARERLGWELPSSPRTGAGSGIRSGLTSGLNVGPRGGRTAYGPTG